MRMAVAVLHPLNSVHVMQVICINAGFSQRKRFLCFAAPISFWTFRPRMSEFCSGA